MTHTQTLVLLWEVGIIAGASVFRIFYYRGRHD